MTKQSCALSLSFVENLILDNTFRRQKKCLDLHRRRVKCTVVQIWSEPTTELCNNKAFGNFVTKYLEIYFCTGNFALSFRNMLPSSL